MKAFRSAEAREDPALLQVAAALGARHIGGAVNYVGVAETLGISGSAQAAGLAADNLVCAAYFAVIFHLARHIPADQAVGTALSALPFS